MLSFFPRGVLDEILNLIESVSEGFPSYSYEVSYEGYTSKIIATVSSFLYSGIIECSQPVPCVSTQLKKYRVDPKIKESWTTFERLSYNGKTSVVKCK